MLESFLSGVGRAFVTVELNTARAIHHPVWLQYCIASGGLSMRVAEQPTEALLTSHLAHLITNSSVWLDAPVVEPLMIAFVMIQVHHSTPIIPNCAKAVPRGTPGTAARS